MSGFVAHAFDLVEAGRELGTFGDLLRENDDLRERAHILRAFAGWPNLCALFGQFHGRIGTADRFRHEMALAHFRADLTVGLAGTNNYCFIEFEGARRGSIFRRTGRGIPRWSVEFERGFSQIVDWAWAHDIHKATPAFLDTFGFARLDCLAILVIGRDHELADSVARDRWGWRGAKVKVDGWAVALMTYDELFLHFDIGIKGRLREASRVRGQP